MDVVLHVPDVARAASFYASVFGPEAEDGAFRGDGVTLRLVEGADAADVIRVAVDDVDFWLDRFEAAGATVRRHSTLKRGLRLGHVADPLGRRWLIGPRVTGPTPAPEVDVVVTDLEAATAFYAAVFERSATRYDEGEVRIQLSSVALHLRMSGEDDPWYEPGKTPRLELSGTPGDTLTLAERFVAHGALLRTPPKLEPDTRYVHVIDPFGHLWALSGHLPPDQ